MKRYILMALILLVTGGGLVSLSGCEVDVHDHDHHHGWYDDHHAWHEDHDWR